MQPQKPTPTPTPTELILDELVIERLIEAIDRKDTMIFLKRFLKDCKKWSKELKKAAQKEDLKKIENITHTFGSSAGTVGAIRLYKFCLQIEICCTQNQPDEALIMAAHFPALIKETTKEIKAYIAKK